MRLFYFVILSLLAAGAARAEVAVVSGGRVQLTAISAVDQVCHSLGPMSVGVLQQPHAGSIIVDTIKGYPNYPAFNTRSHCNTLKLPQTRISYQSAPGFIGSDETVVEIIGPLGGVRSPLFHLRPPWHHCTIATRLAGRVKGASATT
jgi:hypothetical protein